MKGGINWDETSVGRRLGGHVKAVFTIITFIFVACVSLTVTSFKEIPLWAIATSKAKRPAAGTNLLDEEQATYGALDNVVFDDTEQPPERVIA